jgi:hypothetical protein
MVICRSVRLFALACLITISISPAPIRAETPEGVLTVETTGTAPVRKDNPSAAEEGAIRNALTLAVDEALKTILPPEVLAGNLQKVRSLFHETAEAYVLNYTKLAVTQENDYCRVLVRTSILTGEIRERLEQSGITASARQNNQPRIFQIRIRGAGYLAGLNTFRNMLGGIDGINRPQLNEMKADEAIMTAGFPGNSRELASALAQARSDLLAITVTDVQEDGVVVELATPGVAAD